MKVVFHSINIYLPLALLLFIVACNEPDDEEGGWEPVQKPWKERPDGGGGGPFKFELEEIYLVFCTPTGSENFGAQKLKKHEEDKVPVWTCHCDEGDFSLGGGVSVDNTDKFIVDAGPSGEDAWAASCRDQKHPDDEGKNKCDMIQVTCGKEKMPEQPFQ